jgi:hypothetical protein
VLGVGERFLAINLKHQRLVVNFPNPGVCAKSLQTMITYLLNNTRLGRVILAFIGFIAVSYIEGNTQSLTAIESLSPLTMVAAIVMACSSSVVFASLRTRFARA